MTDLITATQTAPIRIASMTDVDAAAHRYSYAFLYYSHVLLTKKFDEWESAKQLCMDASVNFYAVAP